MPVDTLHAEYKAHSSDWKLMRDVVRGHKAIQKEGILYLPKLNDQSEEEYEAYKKRATFFNATGRVVDAMVGMVFRKEPEVTVPAAMKPILDDVTLTGVPFNAFAQDIMKELQEVNRLGVLIDFPNVNVPGVVTVAVAQQKGLRTYATAYRAEDIINWRTSQVDGKTVLSLVVLRECIIEVDPNDVFEVKDVLQYRVLQLVDGFYEQSLYRAVEGVDKTSILQVVAQFTPVMNGNKLDYIPFVFFSSKGNEPAIEQSVLYDLAVVNLAHYRNDADMEHGLHFTGLPTAVISGVKSDDTYRIGSAVAWVFGDKDAKASYLEFKGEGLKQLRDAKKDKEEGMAALGARMLAPEKKDAEAAETIATKRQGETGTLGSMANSESRGLTRVLEILRDWSQASGNVSVKLNTDFNPFNLTA